jgi:signal transduction histidine kinase
VTALALLRAVPLFAQLPDDDLARIAAAARVDDVPRGTTLIAEGSEPDAMYVVADGEFAVTKRSAAGPMTLNVCGAGELLGELSLLAGQVRTASVTATRDARVVVLPVAALHELLRASLPATLAILRTMAARLANTESVLRQHDTLAGLGRIAAGLAHELNNPASAVKRGAAELDGQLARWRAAALALRTTALDDAQLAQLAALEQPAPLGEPALARARREQTLEAALARRGLPDPWELAPTLAALQWDEATLDELARTLPASAIPTAVRWIEAAASVRAIARDLGDAAGRISDLVAAVKTNARLDEAPVHDVDLHAALDATLRLYAHRFGSVTVRRDYAPDLPKVEAYASELNQVWTNLVDNALYALGGRGELVVATERVDDGHVAVSIIDSGPGIPAELQAEVWKPFVTTKPPGEGSGLGLHLAYTVVVRRHRGRIELTSRPGRTCFRITLPIAR